MQACWIGTLTISHKNPTFVSSQLLHVYLFALVLIGGREFLYLFLPTLLLFLQLHLQVSNLQEHTWYSCILLRAVMASHMDHAIIQSKREKRYPELVTLGGGGGRIQCMCESHKLLNGSCHASTHTCTCTKTLLHALRDHADELPVTSADPHHQTFPW